MNPFDPSDDDLRAWARAGELAPVEDFDLMVSTPERAPLLIVLELGERFATEDEVLALWVDRSRKLIARPETFDYGLWCDGGFAYGEEL